MIRTLIADDHAVVRRGLRHILEETSDIVVAAEAGTASEVLDKLRARNYDVLVLDITMPGRSGLDILKEIKRLRPRLPVLVLSIHPEDQFATRVLRAGAAGYLAKETAPDDLVKAIRRVHGGGKYINATQAEKLLQLLAAGSDQAPHERLSDREYEVLRRIASGDTVSAIAAEMKLSVKTVSTYRARLLEKMRMRTNAELTRYAIEGGIA
jgi:two-component system, NarL family, invasion response regulator UvrY